MKPNILKIIESLFALIMAVLLLTLFYLFFYPNINSLAYRWVAAFLSVIILSNLGARFLVNYFNRDKL